MKRLWHETQMTVVMVTHDMREAFTLATRVVAFERKRDRPEEKERYGATITKDISIWPPRLAGGALACVCYFLPQFCSNNMHFKHVCPGFVNVLGLPVVTCGQSLQGVHLIDKSCPRLWTTRSTSGLIMEQLTPYTSC
jgi:energy-coupling factor transporter ATP-binding protein EcfA2